MWPQNSGSRRKFTFFHCSSHWFQVLVYARVWREQKSEVDGMWGERRWHRRRHHRDGENHTRWICNQLWKYHTIFDYWDREYQTRWFCNLQPFAIPGDEKERTKDVPIYNEMMKLNQDTSFEYFVGEFQRIPAPFLSMTNIFSQSLHLWRTSLLNANGEIGSTMTTPTRGLKNVKRALGLFPMKIGFIQRKYFTGERD